MKIQITAIISIVIFITFSPSAYSHGGGLDSSGCHNNYRTGHRHCHRIEASSSQTGTEIISAPVTLLSVGDGDTVRITSGNASKITIRLACIDAPETSQGISGKWSTQTLKRLIQGKPISIKPQIKDRYGRTVAEIYQGSLNINLEMVKLGAAFAYRKYLRQCDSETYLAAEAIAKKRKLGIWGSHKVVEKPWDYRRKRRSK